MKRIGLMVFVVVAACGGGGGSALKELGAGGAAPSSQAGFEREMLDYTQQLIDKKLSAADVYDRYSARCRAQKPFKDFAGEYLMGLGMMDAIFGKGAKASGVQIASFNGTSALAIVEITTATGAKMNGAGDVPAPYVLEGGRWRTDKCD